MNFSKKKILTFLFFCMSWRFFLFKNKIASHIFYTPSRIGEKSRKMSSADNTMASAATAAAKSFNFLFPFLLFGPPLRFHTFTFLSK